MTPYEEYKRQRTINIHKSLKVLEVFVANELGPLGGQEGTNEIWNALDDVSAAVHESYPKGD